MATKYLKMQKTASTDSKTGKIWENIIENCLNELGYFTENRVVRKEYDNEIDIILSMPKGDIYITIAHVKQRNPKEKFYRLIDELFLFRASLPNKKICLIFIGSFLSESGWPQVLMNLYDYYIHLPPENFSTDINQNQGITEVNEDEKRMIKSTLKENFKLNPKISNFSKTIINFYNRKIKFEKCIFSDGLTAIRRPLLKSLMLRHSIIEQVKSGHPITFNDEYDITRHLPLEKKKSLKGVFYKIEEDVSLFVKNNFSQIVSYESNIRKVNPIYSSYIDDVRDPKRLYEIAKLSTQFFKDGPEATLKALRNCRNGLISCSHVRYTNWILECMLVSISFSRNQFDKILSEEKNFPNARNVTGRYIYGEFKSSKKFSIEDFENQAVKVFSKKTQIFSIDKILQALFSDRTYAISVIQNPKPLDAIIDHHLETYFHYSDIEKNVGLPGLINKIISDTEGKSAGRLGVVPFQRKVNKGNGIFIRFLSGFDRANINHKLKELSTKVISIRAILGAPSDQPTLIAVLDGTWQSDDMKSLIKNGYDYVCSTNEFENVLKKILKK